MSRTLSRGICVVVIALLATGCAHGVPIPRDRWEPAEKAGSYRIRLHGRVEYLVTSYTLSDSTVVISGLSPSDQRFVQGREALPIEIPLAQVSSISRMELYWPMTILAITVVCSLVALGIWISTWEGWADE